jgi:hypothetical protein
VVGGRAHPGLERSTSFPIVLLDLPLVRLLRPSWTLPLGALLLVACEQGRPLAQTHAQPTGSASAAPAAPLPQPLPPLPIPHEPHPPGLPQPDDRIRTDGPRVYALTRNVWIRSAPQSDVQWIGSLWLGGSVEVRGPERVPGAGCGNVWVPIEPRGWVCVDERRATMNPELPALVRLYPERPRTETAWPHRYATVPTDVTRYRLPPEVAPGSPDAATLQAQLPFALLDSGNPDLPPGLYEGRTKIVARSALAYVRELPLGEHTYLLMPDLSFVRRDRVELAQPSRFQGVELGGEQRLPIAFVREEGARLHRWSPAGDPAPAGAPLARGSHLALSGQTRESGGETYHELRGSADWIKQRDTVIPAPRAKPWGDAGPPAGATWLEAGILGGWLVAFVGTEPVYATLISAGRGGTPVAHRDAVSTASTPTGRFFITGKFATATMESSTTPMVHGDVPWTQNFSGPHAIHSAYWHDDFGQLKSAGCVNVSPMDGKWLFGFTQPAVPQGWHAVKHVSRDGPATLLILHE